MIAAQGSPFVESAYCKNLLEVVSRICCTSNSDGAGPEAAVGAVVLHCEKSKAHAANARSLSVFIVIFKIVYPVQMRKYIKNSPPHEDFPVTANSEIVSLEG